jgi:PDZ domain-containing protein/aspartyl protease
MIGGTLINSGVSDHMTSGHLRFASFKRTASAAIAIACISTLAMTQQLQPQPAPAPSSVSPIVRLPMDLFAGRVPFITIATKGGRLLHVILDTGANDDILNARVVSELHLHVLDPRRVEQPGGAVEMGKVDPTGIQLGTHLVDSIQFVSIPLDGLQPFLGRSFDGILGYGFLSRFVVELDYDKREVSFFDPATYVAPRNVTLVPITFRGKSPLVSVKLARPDGALVTTWLELDTGSFEGLGLDGAWVKREGLLSGHEPTRPIFGLAIGGETKGFRFRIPSAHIGPYSIARPVASATTSDNAGSGFSDVAGVLGGEILNRFRVILDYRNSSVFLVPASRLAKRSDWLDMLGAQVVAAGPAFDTLQVRAIMPNSPASEAKLRIGDVIRAVDGVSGRRLTLERLGALMGVPERRRILRVQRGAGDLTIVLRTRRLI